MASILLVVKLIAVLLFYTKCSFGNTCDCDMVRNIMTNEIFDLKVENQQLVSRIEKIELAMSAKSPVYQSTKTDTGRIEMMETRINYIESKMPDSKTYSGNLQSRIPKWLRSEKIERVKSEMKIAAGLKEIDDSLKTFKVKSDAILVSHIGNISDRVGAIKMELSENFSLVRKEVMTVSNQVVKLANQTSFLIENNITTIEMSMDAMSNDFSKMGADMDAMNKIVSKMGSDMDAMNNDLSMTGADMEAMNNDLSKMGADMDAMNKIVSKMGSDMDAMNNDLSKTGADMEAMNNDLSKMGADMDAMNKIVSKMGSDIDAMNNDLSMTGADMEAMNNDLSKMGADMDAMNKIVSKMGSDIDAMNNDLSKTGADMEAMNNDWSKTGADIDAMNNDLIKVGADMDAMNKIVSKMGSDMDAMNNDLSKTGADMEAMNNDWSKMGSDMDAMNNDLSKTGADMEAMNNDLSKMGADMDAVNKIVSKMGSDMDAMNNDLSKTGADMEAMNNDLSKTGADIDAMNNDLSKMDADIEAMNNDFSKMDADIEVMNNDFSKMDADIEAMNNDFSKMEADIKAVIDIVLLEQKAECSPNCTNGGVCFRNNTCKCTPFTEGPRCEKVVCEDKCYENGGKCIGPGTCKCPEDRQGSNCEQQVLRCELISNYYGGDVTYFGDRKLYSQAFYRCQDAFSLFPSDVDMSECDDTLRWIPDPPKCYKKTKRDIPANGYSPGSENDILLHLQSYEVCCNKGYELYELKSGVYMEKKCMRLTNNNGTLVPKVPKCVEARCLFSGYPSNEDTLHRIYLADSHLVADDQYVHPGQTIEVFCPTKTEYELYVNTTQTHLEEFTSECKQGRFDKRKEEFPICLGTVYYLISVRTGSQTYAGTDASVYITLHGQKGETDKIYLAGSFEKYDLDETRRQALDIRPITKVDIGHDGSGISSEWYLKYVSIYVEDMEEYYVFRHNDWVREENDVTLLRQGLDQENCIDSFDNGNKWWPDYSRIGRRREYTIGSGKRMSLTKCKQGCLTQTTIQCVSVYYSRVYKTCWGMAVSHKSYFIETSDATNSMVYLRTCKQFD